ncbi:MAG TPA: hypothetical protein VFG50_03895 [Rhodothermales bacterium]|nr:hypothetical protein [Rhodothermales bacterium]
MVRPGAEQEANRTALFLTPTARLSYLTPGLFGVRGLLFAGYGETGGRSQEHDDIRPCCTYQDSFRFRSLEAGLFAMTWVWRLRVGPGVKVSRRLSVRDHVHRELKPRQAGPITPEDRVDVSWLFDPYAAHVGARLEWPVLRHVVVAGEGWFGITQIEGAGYSRDINARQNHFSVLVGFRL